MNEKICMYCKAPVSMNYECYLVRLQHFKFQRREHIGYACDACVEDKGCKTEYKLWQGDKRP